MRITKKICVLMSWSLLIATVLSGCTYYAALERETKREVRTKKEWERAKQDNNNLSLEKLRREARLEELKKQIADIEGELDELEGRKKEEERKINRLYAEDKQLKKRKEELLKVKKEFEPKINRLTVEKKRKKKELLQLQQENAE